jgi:septal ring factor EnvC (AmiA/AmiB activator)
VTTAEIEHVKRVVLEQLPEVLEPDPGFARWLEGLLSEKFPRRDEFARLLDEVQASRRENKEQFARVDERLDKVDGRFTQVDQRFDQVDQRFTQVDEQFKKVDQRFDRVEQRLDKLEQRMEDVVREVKGLRDWMELKVGGFQTRAGRRLEDVVAGAFCYGLERQDMRPEQVHLRQTIEDTQGLVWRAGRKREVDLIASGAEIIVFEVKSTADRDHIEDLADKVTLVRATTPEKQVHGVLGMLGAESGHRQRCSELGLRLIP